MNKKVFLKASIDGLTQGIASACLGQFLISTYTFDFTLTQCMVFGTVLAIICGSLYLGLVINERQNKSILLFSLVSILIFIGTFLCVTIFQVSCSYSPISLREVNNADGVLLLVSMLFTFALSFVLKLSIFFLMLIKNSFAVSG